MAKEKREEKVDVVELEGGVTENDLSAEEFISVNELVSRAKSKGNKKSDKDVKAEEKAAKKKAKREAKAKKTYMKFVDNDTVDANQTVVVEAEVLTEEETKALEAKEKESRFGFDGDYVDKDKAIQETDFDREARRANEMRVFKSYIATRIEAFRSLVADAQKTFKKARLRDVYVAAGQANIDWLQNVCMVTADRVFLIREIASLKEIDAMPVKEFLEKAKGFTPEKCIIPNDALDVKVARKYAGDFYQHMVAYYEVLEKYPGTNGTIKMKKFKEDATKEEVVKPTPIISSIKETTHVVERKKVFPVCPGVQLFDALADYERITGHAYPYAL